MYRNVRFVLSEKTSNEPMAEVEMLHEYNLRTTTLSLIILSLWLDRNVFFLHQLMRSSLPPTHSCLLTLVVTGRNEVLAKVIFLHLSVILFTGGEYLTRHTPPGTTPPRDQVPPRIRYPPDQVHPPGNRYPPRDQVHPPGPHPPRPHPPGPGTPRTTPPLGPGTPPTTPPLDQVPPPAATSGILSTIGRYASYWIAFLFLVVFKLNNLQVM